MKFYVCSGNHRWIMEENNHRAAAIKAINKLELENSSENFLGRLIMVSEKGFEGDGDDDMFFCTIDLLDDMGQLQSFISLEWSDSEDAQQDQPLPY